ncbi:MAG: peptidogalycan biosysnthesis protein [Deltaproteobacteria bacterium]|nr:peptidogalycan biosysnthesis protein [Deltaproteobacteria bacterium]
MQAQRYKNMLEPPELVELFLRFPPEGFACGLNAAGLPVFHTDFDILTTLETAARARLRRVPLYAAWSDRLRFAACFAGTTVTEYAPVPDGLSTEDFLDNILNEHCKKQTLTILKDLPEASPLLSAEENAFAEKLVREATGMGFMQVRGQALAYLPIDFRSVEEYLLRLSPGRRKDLRRKMKMRDALEIEILRPGDKRFADQRLLDEFYALYLEVFRQSEIHFDLLSADFFAALLQSRAADGVVFCYRSGQRLAGYNICFIHQGGLVDKYIGLSYPLARELNLYFISWMVNLEFALENRLSVYISGWTDPEVKAALGARFTFTRHLVWVKNPLLRAVLSPLRRFFEADAQNLVRGKSC